MADFLHVGFGATVGMLLQCVQTQVDVGPMCILVPQPCLEFVAGYLPSRGDSLHRLPGLMISHKHCQPIRGFEVVLDVASSYSLGLHCAFLAGNVGTDDGAVGGGTRI